MSEAPESLLTAEQIRAGIHKLAQEGEGGDRRWALKVLYNEQTAEVAIPEPLHEKEIIDRLARVMRPAGKNACRIAYRRAFGDNTPVQITDAPILKRPAFEIHDAQVAHITTLRKFYKRFPYAQRRYPDGRPMGGTPTGYPMGRSRVVQEAWIKRESKRLIAEEEMQRISDQAAADKEVSPAPEQTETPPEQRLGQ